MLPGRLRVGRASYVRIKLREETHHSWVQMKRLCCAQSDDDFARDLLMRFTESIASQRNKKECIKDTSCDSNSNGSVTRTAEDLEVISGFYATHHDTVKYSHLIMI